MAPARGLLPSEPQTTNHKPQTIPTTKPQTNSRRWPVLCWLGLCETVLIALGAFLKSEDLVILRVAGLDNHRYTHSCSVPIRRMLLLLRFDVMYVKKFATYVGVFAVLSIGSAQATLLVPGGDVPLPGVVYAPGTFVASASRAFVGLDAGGATRFTGRLDVEVWVGAFGLDFWYIVTNDSSSLDAITRFTNLSFAGWTTDVIYDTTRGGPVAPAFATRSTDGSVVGFEFEASGPGGLLDPGEFTSLVVIQTNAPSYTRGSTAIINGGSGSVESFAPVPEPATMALAGLALGAAVRRRARKR